MENLSAVFGPKWKIIYNWNFMGDKNHLQVR